MQLTKLSPISHLVTREEFFVFEAFSDDFGTTLNDSPNSELDFKLCHAYHTRTHPFTNIQLFHSKESKPRKDDMNMCTHMLYWSSNFSYPGTERWRKGWWRDYPSWMLRSNTRQECSTRVTRYAGLHACQNTQKDQTMCKDLCFLEVMSFSVLLHCLWHGNWE